MDKSLPSSWSKAYDRSTELPAVQAVAPPSAIHPNKVQSELSFWDE